MDFQSALGLTAVGLQPRQGVGGGGVGGGGWVGTEEAKARGGGMGWERQGQTGRRLHLACDNMLRVSSQFSCLGPSLNSKPS